MLRETSYYSGPSSYKHVERLMRRSKELCIVSPYIDSYYARFLKRISGGKRIYIISSSINGDADLLLAGGRSPWFAVTLSLTLVLVNYMAFLLKALNAYLLGASALAICVSVLMFARKKPNSVKIKKPGAFVHAKMYIADDEAIEGSANLTYSGMHKNIEGISVTRDRDRVYQMKEQFWKMWKKY